MEKVEKLTQELHYYFNNVIKKRYNEYGDYHVGIIVKNNNVIIDVEYSLKDVPIDDLIFALPITMLYSMNQSYVLYGPNFHKSGAILVHQHDIISMILKYFPTASDISFTYDFTKITITFDY